MSKNPFLNALAAALYIIVIASVLSYAPQLFGPDEPKGPLVPIAMISLFTLSAATMGYFFLLAPAQLYLDNKKKEAVNLFVQTVAIFAGFTIVFFLILASRIFS